MSVADAFLTFHGQVYGLWPYEASSEAHHFLFEADPRRLAALVGAVHAFERTAEAATLVDFLARERPGFDLALDAVRGHVLASELEAVLREDGDARAAWLDAREDAGGVRTHRYRTLQFGLRRLRQLEELGAAREIIQFERDELHRLVREPPAPGALVQAARERAEAGYLHEVFGLCLQTALLPEARDWGYGVLPSLDVDAGPCPLPRTLISDASEAHAALLSDGLYESMGAITWGAAEDLERTARGLQTSDLADKGWYGSAELAPALARMGARGSCAVSFTAMHDTED
ncbi:hypothetical protein [Vitiosangium sp. GDMCC 1.1324]|uniref:hypothetical protein n=1 Tax=Vitiosangium sp. (strain GDMCC 1.1324) TaxID=2138576 RepID=UPI000D3707DF|nr:hypothetical protein [Vitiosangium sp. GDMCC 1.1324]PTL82686.1 hypothetical protein DAT35_18060 [Vitiosangium sp. GDMCC 1.1324]